MISWTELAALVGVRVRKKRQHLQRFFQCSSCEQIFFSVLQMLSIIQRTSGCICTPLLGSCPLSSLWLLYLSYWCKDVKVSCKMKYLNKYDVTFLFMGWTQGRNYTIKWAGRSSHILWICKCLWTSLTTQRCSKIMQVKERRRSKADIRWDHVSNVASYPTSPLNVTFWMTSLPAVHLNPDGGAILLHATSLTEAKRPCLAFVFVKTEKKVAGATT